MPTTVNFENLIEYTVLAATTAKTIAETTRVPFLWLNRCIVLVNHKVHREIKGVLPTAFLYDIAKFTEALEKLFTILNGQQRGALRKIKGLFRQPEAGERLEACKQELSRMVELFKAQVTGSTLSQMGQMKKDAKEQHEQLVALLETDSDLTNSDRSSVAGTLGSLGNNSSGSFGLLPPCPQIFHGREAELRDVVNALHGICQVLILTGKPLSALMHTKEAYRCTQHMGDIYGQAWSLYLQARCHVMLANYQHARHLLQNSRDMLTACGQQQGALWLTILNVQAEIHLLKSEYQESHQIQIAIASSCHPTSHIAVMANLNIAIIDIACMNSISTTLRWSGVFLSLALKCKEKFHTMQAFRCLGQIFLAEGDDETALSLFNVALDGFTFMDVHRWRADCMVRIADILNSRGEVMKAVGLWKTARPLFERSSQMKDIIKLDAKLAEVDSAVLVKYEAKLQHLVDLCVPCIAPEEKYVVEDEEEEEDKLVQTTDFGDNGSTLALNCSLYLWVFGQIHTHLFSLLLHLNQFAKTQSCRGMKPGSGVGGSTTLFPVLWQEKRQSGSEAMLHGGSVSSTNAFSFINIKGKVGIPRLPLPTH
ncbi:hypothetical protein C8J57DRAFT_1680067 [Mycena rebaudengoi]|nr:hypothetical protein C8J57DRAFT_1680067 [Mycena rebaudengoi]